MTSHRAIPERLLAGGSGSGTWWIDDLGKWRFVDKSSQLGHLNAPVAAQSEGFVYRLLGMVKVSLQARVLSLQWDVRCAEVAAMDSLLRFLERLPDSVCVRLTYFFGAWTTELHRGAGSALHRLRQLGGYRSLAPFPRPLLQRRPLEEISRTSPMIQRAYAAWIDMAGKGDVLAFGVLAERGLYDRAVIYKRRPLTDGLYFYRVGPSSALAGFLGQEWALGCVGRLHDSDPVYRTSNDPIFGTYAAVLADGEPRLDYVRAPLDRGDGEPVWASYERLVLGWPDGEGGFTLVNFSHPQQETAAPFLAAA